MERAFDAVVGHEIRKLNSHLPRSRKTLSKLLEETNPTVEAVDGSSILLKPSELRELARIVPEEYRDRLRLPLIVLRRIELGKSIYTVAGGQIEEFTVKKILGSTKLEYLEMYKDREATFLYRPQVSELLGRFHSLVVIGFGVTKELPDYDSKRD